MPGVKIAAYSDRFEADIVVARLAAAGIHAFVSADDLAGAFPLMHLSEGGCRVLVRQSQATAAVREITRIGNHATDTRAVGSRGRVTEEKRAERSAYVIGALLGWLLGTTPWHTLFRFVTS